MKVAINFEALFVAQKNAAAEQEAHRKRMGGRQRPHRFEESVPLDQLTDPLDDGRRFDPGKSKPRNYEQRFGEGRDAIMAGSPQRPAVLVERQGGFEFFDAESKALAGAAFLAGCSSVPAVVLDRRDT